MQIGVPDSLNPRPCPLRVCGLRRYEYCQHNYPRVVERNEEGLQIGNKVIDFEISNPLFCRHQDLVVHDAEETMLCIEGHKVRNEEIWPMSVLGNVSF